jgi:hypothetical protein
MDLERRLSQPDPERPRGPARCVATGSETARLEVPGEIEFDNAVELTDRMIAAVKAGSPSWT